MQEKFERDIARCWCDQGWAQKKSLSLSLQVVSEASTIEYKQDDVRNVAGEMMNEKTAPTMRQNIWKVL